MNSTKPIDLVLSKNNTNNIHFIGVGGGGCNAINYIFQEEGYNENLILCDNKKDLQNSFKLKKIQIGKFVAKEEGSKTNSLFEKKTAIEDVESFIKLFQTNADKVCVISGLGGRTGTGATPVLLREAKKYGKKTIAIVTMPFSFEGEKRKLQAIHGLSNISQYADLLHVIHNEQILQIYGDDITAHLAFKKIDEMIYSLISEYYLTKMQVNTN